jgi:K+-transporting ATPase ATPase C chain
MGHDFWVSLRSIFLLWVLTAVLYPAVVLLVGQTALPFQANGSLLTNAQGQVVGSALIGQSFTSDKYFWGRPSSINYSEGEQSQPTGRSGGSNLAPSNPDLLTRVGRTAERLAQAGIAPTADMLYSSGSGLDPHISPEGALAQVARVARARSISNDRLEQLIKEHTEGRWLGIFGEAGVNVLKLNLALDGL